MQWHPTVEIECKKAFDNYQATQKHPVDYTHFKFAYMEGREDQFLDKCATAEFSDKSVLTEKYEDLEMEILVVQTRD